jgi:putative Ca2+/H+ antiporter (TMEM165/GDT1 family)
VERELGSGGKQAEENRPSKGVQQVLRRYFSPVFVEALVLNFLAEWGDRSQVRSLAVTFWGFGCAI